MRLYGPNVLTNGGFELGSTSGWAYWNSGAANGTAGVNSSNPYAGLYDAVINVVSAGPANSDISFQQSPVVFRTGETYAVRFASKISSARALDCTLQNTDGSSLASAVYSAAPSYSLFENLYSMPVDTSSGRVVFHCGSGEAFTLNLDNIELRGYTQLAPEWDYERLTTRNRTDDRTRAGALYTTLNPGGFTRFRLPLSWVSSLDRSIVTSWWKSGAELLYVENDNFPFSYHSVRIMGVEEPFQSSMDTYYQTYYSGEIILETV